jgi:hypothetical protein
MERRLIPPDSDHIYVLGHLNQNLVPKKINTIFSEIGEINNNISSNNSDGELISFKVSMFADRILKWRTLNLPKYVIDMPSWKIRVNFTSTGLFCIIPIAFPEFKDKLSENHHSEICLCKKYNDESWKRHNKNADSLLTCYCVTINTQLCLLVKFINDLNRKLKSINNKLVIDTLIYSDGKNVFGDESLEKQLWYQLLDRIK